MSDDRKTKLIEVFQDTQSFCAENEALKAAVSYGREHSKLYEAGEYPALPDISTKNGAVCVIKAKTFETAMERHRAVPGKKITVLNFASATRPGGGVKTGSSAQEESLCRCSTLYPALDQNVLWQGYYEKNRAARNNLYSDACIYTPGVIICKTDDSIPKRLSQDDFVTVDVISCAAPNLRRRPSNYQNPSLGEPVRVSNAELHEIHVKRGKHILHVAATNDTDILILGAFGCGAFANDPKVVAKAYRDIMDEYRGYFDEVIFAVYCRDRETENYTAFKERLADT